MSKDHLRKGERVEWVDSMVAGSISGLIARALTAPMDTLKIRYQLQPVQESKYRGIVSTVGIIVREEGWRALWKGNVPASAMYVAYGAVQFGSYSWYNNVLSEHAPYLSQQGQSLVVGAMAGMTSSAVTYPLDLLRTRLIANRWTRALKLGETCREMWRHEGPKGFFTGISSAMTTVTVSSALMFLTYESVNIVCETHREQRWSQPLQACSGMLAGLVSKTVVFPIDTVRRRMQVMNSARTSQFTDHPSVYHGYRNRSFTYILWGMVAKEGPRSIYRGLTMGLCKTVPTTAISLFVYERAIQYLERPVR